MYRFGSKGFRQRASHFLLYLLLVSLCLPAATVQSASRQENNWNAPAIKRLDGADATAPSEQGRRAKAYMQSGLQGGEAWRGGNTGNKAFDAMHPKNVDSARGGRRDMNNASRTMDAFEPMQLALDYSLNWGSSMLNAAGESAISSLVDGGRARLNFMFDKDGHFKGEGDALLPLYDSQNTTVFAQLGARSMHDDGKDRWIGNAGLGQRWFPAATEEGSGNWMLGYNAFYDYDFTRDHQRGGVGVEAQYDWLRLASNYYFPLSSWRGSKDFDSAYVKERAAKGWDARVKGYLPFYRNVALTGSYSQWYGDSVGVFGRKDLEKDPKVWAYGLEYTPVPLVSGFVTQKSTERGKTDTEFGMNLTYHFNVPLAEQTSHAKVAELRTVDGGRHEFVDRENKIILEYKAKNKYVVEFVRRVGNTITFRLRDGLGKYPANQPVKVTASGTVVVAEAKQQDEGVLGNALAFLDSLISVRTAHAAAVNTYSTDANGMFQVQVSNIDGPFTLTVQAAGSEWKFPFNDAYSTSLTSDKSILGGQESATLTFKGEPNTPVSWKLVSGPAKLQNAQKKTDATGIATAVLVSTNPDMNNIISSYIDLTDTVDNTTTKCKVFSNSDTHHIAIRNKFAFWQSVRGMDTATLELPDRYGDTQCLSWKQIFGGISIKKVEMKFSKGILEVHIPKGGGLGNLVAHTNNGIFIVFHTIVSG